MSERKIVLEVGFGSKPFPTQGKRKMERGEVYIGVDTGYLASIARARNMINVDLFAKAQERIDQRLPKRDRYHLMYADGTQLPMPDHSVSEVVFINVFGIPEELLLDKGGERVRLLTVEASRVLKKGGLVTVVETLDPDVSPFPRLNELMRSIGFKCLTSTRDIETLKPILEYAENPYLRPDINKTNYALVHPYSARFQHS